MFHLKIFSNCYRKKKTEPSLYEENLYYDESRNDHNDNLSLIENQITNLDTSNLDTSNLELLFTKERRIRNMCYRWKITRLQAIELIENVDSRQTVEEIQN